MGLIFFLLPETTQLRFWYVPAASLLSALIIIQTNLFHIFSVKSMLTEATIFQEGTGRNILMCLFFLIIIVFDESLLGLRSIFFSTIFASSFLVIYGLTRFYFSLNIFAIPYSLTKKYFSLSLNFFPSTALLYGSSHIFEILINYLFGPISLAIIAIANRVCELLLFFTHLINLYFVKSSKIYFSGNKTNLIKLSKKCISLSFITTLVLTFLYLLLGHNLAYEFLKLADFEYSEMAIFIMLISTISQSITIFSQNFLTNIGRFKFLIALDSVILIFGIFLLFLTSLYQLAIIPVAVIILLRIIRQITCFYYASSLVLEKKDSKPRKAPFCREGLNCRTGRELVVREEPSYCTYRREQREPRSRRYRHRRDWPGHRFLRRYSFANMQERRLTLRGTKITATSGGPL